ncbi:hypothetical protein HJC23_007463 [Cyclotella cryptica]|uniref:RING-type domain-containing protein n=1 Tax=Cyclotella cryptica TaxID=29204 RepID=A0ABD3QI37_9STRA
MSTSSGNHSSLFDVDLRSSSVNATQPLPTADEATWDTKATILLFQGIFLTILVAVILCACGRKHYHRMNLLRIQELTTIRIQESGRNGSSTNGEGAGNNPENRETNRIQQLLHVLATPLRHLDNVINIWSSSPSTDYEYYNRILERMEREKEESREGVEERTARLMNAFLKEQCVYDIKEEHFTPQSSLKKHVVVDEHHVNEGDNCNQADIENGLNNTINNDSECYPTSEVYRSAPVIDAAVADKEIVAAGSDARQEKLGDESTNDIDLEPESVDDNAVQNDNNSMNETKAQNCDLNKSCSIDPSAVHDEPSSDSSEQTPEAAKMNTLQKLPSSTSLDGTPRYLYINTSHSNTIRDTNTGPQPTANSETASTTSSSQASVPSPLLPNNNSEAPTTQASTNQRIIPNLCAICLCDYIIGDSIVLSPNIACPHAFHRECIMEWLVKMQDGAPCPCCRQTFVELENEGMKNDVMAGREMSEEELGRLRRHIQLGLQRGRAFDASVITFW